MSIRVTLNEVPAAPLQLPAPKAPEPMPERIARFWNFDERTPPPWHIESSEDRQSREQAERDGGWTG